MCEKDSQAKNKEIIEDNLQNREKEPEDTILEEASAILLQILERAKQERPFTSDWEQELTDMFR